MLECIATKNINRKQHSVRFIRQIRFAIYKDGSRVPIKKEEDLKNIDFSSDDFDRMAEYRTYYDLKNKSFSLLEEKVVDSDDLILIDEDIKEVDGWSIGIIKNESNN